MASGPFIGPVAMAGWSMIPDDCPKCGAAFKETDKTPIPNTVWNKMGDVEELVCVGCNQPFARWDYINRKGWERVDG